ncbi:hypothetical protein ISCGN_007669 [Ixodes scapularis]
MKTSLPPLHVWILVQYAALVLGGKQCSVYHPTFHVDWPKLGNVKLYEIRSFPSNTPMCCVTRAYDLLGKKMYWTNGTRFNGVPSEKREYSFIVKDDAEYLKKDGRLFQQVLTTDNYSWALLHICWNEEGTSKFVLAAREPWTVIPREVQQKIHSALSRVATLKGKI